MPAPRKPKKAFVQFAIAAVIAVVVTIGAIFAGITIIAGVTGEAQKKEKELLAQQQELEAERERLRKMNEQPTVVSYDRVKAVVDLEPGQPIMPEMLTLEKSSTRPNPGDLTMLKQAVNKMVKTMVPAGSPLSGADLLDMSGYLNVPQGMRAITINVDNIGSLNGALATGVRVDVLATVVGEDKIEAVSRTLLQNVQVLSAGNEAPEASQNPSLPSQRAASKGGAVTLAVTPKQAETLTLANQMGKFHLTLRSFKDGSKNSLSGSDFNELLTGVDSDAVHKKLPAPPEPADSGWVNVNWNPNDPNLPMPGNGGAVSSGTEFQMEIYRGKAVDTKEFVR